MRDSQFRQYVNFAPRLKLLRRCFHAVFWPYAVLGLGAEKVFVSGRYSIEVCQRPRGGVKVRFEGARLFVWIEWPSLAE